MKKTPRTPPTEDQLKKNAFANDPLWEKIFKLRLNDQNEEAENLKNKILQKHNISK